MNRPLTSAPWALALLTLVAAPVAWAREPDAGPSDTIEVTGRVVRDGEGLLLRRPDRTAYRVEGDAARSLERLVGRSVRVEGAVSMGAPGDVAGLEVVTFLDPRPADLAGVVAERDEVAVLATSEGDVRLGGVPPALLRQLVGRRLAASGWLFRDEGRARELVLTAVDARVAREGWLSERIEDPVGSGKWRYRTTARVHPGDRVRLVELGAYNSTEKAWRTVDATRPGDLLFGVVRLGAPQPGSPAFEGWIPLYKLELGEPAPVADAAAPPVQTVAPAATAAPTAQQQAAPATPGATGVVEDLGAR